MIDNATADFLRGPVTLALGARDRTLLAVTTFARGGRADVEAGTVTVFMSRSQSAEVLDNLRELFLSKALVGRQSRLCEQLLAAGSEPHEVAAMRLADLPDVADARRCRALRRQLGLPDDIAEEQRGHDAQYAEQARRPSGAECFKIHVVLPLVEADNHGTLTCPVKQ